ncbi:MAG: hypothetical protein GY778_26145 [bacterium]|nr:hypothetical protein [bacterium]
MTLNATVPMDEDDDWTPARGLARAAIRGMIVAIVLAAVTGLVAYCLPFLVFNFWLRAALGFVLALIMFATVQNAAGMVGPRCTALAVGLTLLVLLSHHGVAAVHGMGTTNEVLIGWGFWLDPVVLGSYNISALIGVVFCAVLSHSAGASLDTLTDIVSMKVFR